MQRLQNTVLALNARKMPIKVGSYTKNTEKISKSRYKIVKLFICNIRSLINVMGKVACEQFPNSRYE